MFDLPSDHSCCKPSTTVVLPPVLSAVINGVRGSEPVVYNHRPLSTPKSQEAGHFFSQCEILFSPSLLVYLVASNHYSRPHLCMCSSVLVTHVHFKIDFDKMWTVQILEARLHSEFPTWPKISVLCQIGVKRPFFIDFIYLIYFINATCLIQRAIR